jgi:hypothetical protein
MCRQPGNVKGVGCKPRELKVPGRVRDTALVHPRQSPHGPPKKLPKLSKPISSLPRILTFAFLALLKLNFPDLVFHIQPLYTVLSVKEPKRNNIPESDKSPEESC